jgi:signal transduction histidine kinase
MAGLTHELKSPLSAIESAISFLSDLKQSKNISEKEAAYLEMIDRNSTRLREYVNDLLISFGSDDKKKLLTFKNENISALFQTIIEKYSPMAQTKNITIHLSGDSNLECCCDSEKITQVLSNLISNAIKFSEGGMINMSFFQEKGQIHCSVADTGKGIKNEDLPFIFERFYQGDAGRQNKGSGIGLTIAKAWVEAHGGKIWAESPANTMTGEAANNKAGRDGESLPAGRCGRGTTVRFTLPL